MLYALTRNDGGISITCVMPKEITTEGKTLAVSLVDSANKQLKALDGGNELVFPLPSDDMRTYEVDSVPNAVLAFHDIQSEMDKLPDDYVSYEKIAVNDLPASRSYRNAWQVSGKSITINMPKARDIHRARLREARKPMLEVLDVAYQRADEAGDDRRKKEIAKEKQALRDITKDPRIDAARTTDELEKVTL